MLMKLHCSGIGLFFNITSHILSIPNRRHIIRLLFSGQQYGCWHRQVCVQVWINVWRISAANAHGFFRVYKFHSATRKGIAKIQWDDHISYYKVFQGGCSWLVRVFHDDTTKGVFPGFYRIKDGGIQKRVIIFKIYMHILYQMGEKQESGSCLEFYTSSPCCGRINSISQDPVTW